jgi:hypothetical protein
MATLVRPRIAALTLRLDADGDPRESDLLLTTRDGEAVWRGEVGPDAWRAGIRLRSRCQGSWQDAQWLMTRTLLEAELASHGLGWDGAPDLDVDITTTDDGLVLTTTCRIVPTPPYPLLADTTLEAVSWGAARAHRTPAPSPVAVPTVRQGASIG